MALFMIFYKGKHGLKVITKKGGTQKGGTHVANYNIGLKQDLQGQFLSKSGKRNTDSLYVVLANRLSMKSSDSG